MRGLVAAAIGTIAALAAPAAPAGAAGGQEVLREVLRQQSAAQREGCSAISRTLASETDAALVVRTAIEIGYNPCQVVRCAIEGGAALVKVVQGAAEAGVKADVVARCSLDAGADPAALARVLADLVFEPSFCYVTFSPAGAPAPQPPAPPVVGRGYQRAEASPFTF